MLFIAVQESVPGTKPICPAARQMSAFRGKLKWASASWTSGFDPERTLALLCPSFRANLRMEWQLSDNVKQRYRNQDDHIDHRDLRG
jgi:hypothetical protein